MSASIQRGGSTKATNAANLLHLATLLSLLSLLIFYLARKIIESQFKREFLISHVRVIKIVG